VARSNRKAQKIALRTGQLNRFARIEISSAGDAVANQLADHDRVERFVTR